MHDAADDDEDTPISTDEEAALDILLNYAAPAQSE